ncbi:alkylated DNA repair dioxygenase AlkB [Winogradskyella epiphytica]|uniref:Alkylated DNA repair dioxygenase AlkB n=1 Tax=Winogradskyella epiphytica TaxID=262005 RepID=A0A2V4WTU2_9FLAO|nr:alpha-ketoglutarate-dependent dioxygenase AlkB [Winogradskyella epiphytica]PYE80072.1 alkylated DNA repair dioxygenase AlkB [Winogradskyella epiphytica]GGW71209.1 alkylated DNA repair protein [Winogradskyella epiphytica]
MDLFFTDKRHLKLPNAELIYIPRLFSKQESDAFFKCIKSETNWQHDDITIFGKTYKQPRLTALFATSTMSYKYSNITMDALPFSPTLLEIKNRVESISNHEFNSVLINLYRDGNDSNSWHADNEKELGINRFIASVSFGAERLFHFKHQQLKNERHKINLEHGSLLIMKGEMQHYWKHQIAKTKKTVESRINLTFRTLINESN